MDRYCPECGVKVSTSSKTGYCSKHYNIPKNQERVNKWLETGVLPIGPNTRPRGYVRDYLMQEQNCQCAICGIKNTWNDSELVFVLDHIDGQSINNNRRNLRLVCPNCDSQLDTFKSKNKKSTRTYDKEYRKTNSKKQGEQTNGGKQP